jgi:hypothetical protein
MQLGAAVTSHAVAICRYHDVILRAQLPKSQVGYKVTTATRLASPVRLSYIYAILSKRT